TRWETGKSMLVCIDKITCARMLQRIEPRWRAKLVELRELAISRPDDEALRGRIRWMESTIIEIVISEAQNEPRDFAKWGFDIIPHRMVMKTGFQTPDGKRVPLEDAFKNPE